MIYTYVYINIYNIYIYIYIYIYRQKRLKYEKMYHLREAVCQQVCILYQPRQESISSLTIPAKRDYDYKGDYPANIGVDEAKKFRYD